MELTLNGEKREVPEGTTVSKLLELLTVIPERVVVEMNLTILKRAEHSQTILKEGDQVEIVRFVGGGSKGWLQATSHRLHTDRKLLPEACSLKPVA